MLSYKWWCWNYDFYPINKVTFIKTLNKIVISLTFLLKLKNASFETFLNEPFSKNPMKWGFIFVYICLHLWFETNFSCSHNFNCNPSFEVDAPWRTLEISFSQDNLIKIHFVLQMQIKCFHLLNTVKASNGMVIIMTFYSHHFMK